MKPLKWRLYAVENIEADIVRQLRKSKMDVLSVAEDPKLQGQDAAFHCQMARELGRYFITHDEDFWDDRTYPLESCPGVLVPAIKDPQIAAWLVLLLLRKLIHDHNPLPASLKLAGIKIRLTTEGATIHYLDRHTQEPITHTWPWADLSEPKSPKLPSCEPFSRQDHAEFETRPHTNLW